MAKGNADRGFKIFNNRHNAFYIIIIAIFGLALFSPSIDDPLVYSDDNNFILDENTFNSDMSNAGKAFTSAFYGYYRPLFRISFMTDTQIGGTSHTIFHITNILLHILSCILVFYLLKEFLLSKQASFFGAMIYIVHPLMSSAVFWIPGRNETLLAVFMFSSFLFYMKHLNTGKQYFLIFHFITFFISVFVKETAVILPAVIFCYVFLIKRDILKSRQFVISVIVWAIIGIIWFLLRQPTVSTIEKSAITGLTPFIQNILSVPAYFGKMILPLSMNTIASYESISIVSGAVVLVLILILIFKFTTERKILLFGLLWGLLFIIPSLFIRIKGIDDFFDYLEPRAYVPFLGILLLLLFLFENRLLSNRSKYIKYLPVAVIIIFASATMVYSANFSERTEFWKASVDKYPDKARLYYALGKAYVAENMLKEAEINMLKGSSLNPEDNDYNVELAYISIMKNDFKQARLYAKKAVENEPDNAKAYSYLGAAEAAMGNLPGAEKAWIQSINLDPKIFSPYHYLIEYYLSINNPDNVRQYVNQLQSNGGELPDDIKAMLNQAGIRY